MGKKEREKELEQVIKIGRGSTRGTVCWDCNLIQLILTLAYDTELAEASNWRWYKFSLIFHV